ncbi:putative ethyl tert-butyl ether degradation protein [Colletotrichum karsti]|uniref:Ethyl tert-butyl ether degradation protein n=1 Tax=Colletotrichum karsti TaxID=1095194 RepID=A0A9P6LMI8_9PEZI|nr:putative ethyl tert-butyl ether degradation protein [Colletotrichum karsti]KAF9878251.1 putative ethyl tert-butyl ether degradation protein [Colletotrichum karsti]
MAGVSTTVLYPNTPGKTFDINYYLHKHMPYAEKIWGPLGMKDWKMTAFQNAPDGTQAPYRYKVVSRWTSLDDMKNATTTSIGKPVLEDVANFTNEEPIILVGEDLASSE